ncbi:MAG: guanylate kinase [Spirulinaceae cyanobacterium]
MEPGKLILLTGPSGVGKGTLVRSLRLSFPELYLSVSTTTRSPRSGEVEGQHYYFVTKEQFQSMIKGGELLEWAEYAGNFYGTPRSSVEKQLKVGNSVILEIELIGARKIKEIFPQALRIFILPPSVEELEARLRGRGKDSEEVINKRLQRAVEEIAAADEFAYQVVNDDFQAALADIEQIVFAHF